MKRRLYACVSAIVIVAGLAAPRVAYGQAVPVPDGATAVVHGRLMDPDGLPVPGVSVQLDGEGLSSALETISTADGRVRFAAVPRPGAYVVKTHAMGSYVATATRIEIGSEQAAVSVDVRLVLGYAEEVRVTASAIDDRFATREPRWPSQ